MYKKIYNSLISTPGIVITLFLIYFFFYFPLGGNSQTISESIGRMIGIFFPSFIVILLLSRWQKWTWRQKLFHTLILVAITKPLSSTSLSPMINLIYLVSLLFIIILFFKDLITGKRKKEITIIDDK